MPRYLLFVLLLLASTSNLVVAQPMVPTTCRDSLQALPAAAMLPPPTATDTVAALHRLFAARRAGRNVLVAGTILTLGLYAVINQQAADPSLSRDINSLVGLVLIPPLVAWEYVHHARYSHKKEQQALAAFALHQLPASVKVLLHAQFFRPPASANQVGR
jgi:hypothetical protein